MNIKSLLDYPIHVREIAAIRLLQDMTKGHKYPNEKKGDKKGSDSGDSQAQGNIPGVGENFDRKA